MLLLASCESMSQMQLARARAGKHWRLFTTWTHCGLCAGTQWGRTFPHVSALPPDAPWSHLPPSSGAGSPATPSSPHSRSSARSWWGTWVASGAVGMSLDVLCGVSGPSLGRVRLEGLGSGHCVPDREARRLGMQQRQDKGLVVPSEKTQTWFPCG